MTAASPQRFLSEHLLKTGQPVAARGAAGRMLGVWLAGVTLSLGAVASAAGTYVFTRVAVIPMDSERVLAEQDVVVSDDRIASIAASASRAVTVDDAILIDGRGRFLIPGLADMHVHIGGTYLTDARPGDPAAERALRDELVLYLANGVTTVRNMSGSERHLELARQIARGEVPGPWIFTASPILDGTPPAWPHAIPLTDPATARQLVRQYAAKGYDFIKVYHNLTPEVYAAIVEAARAARIPVVGHVPFTVGLLGALDSGQRSFEHLRGYDMAPGAETPTTMLGRFSGFLSITDSMIGQFAEATRVSGTWNCPTLALQIEGAVSGVARERLFTRPEMDFVPPPLRKVMLSDRFYVATPSEVLDAIRRSVPVEFRVVQALSASEAPLMVGTDTPLLMSIPGFALHRELLAMRDAGLTPFQVLRAATTEAARFLGREHSSGTLGAGMQADLVMLEGNPLADIAATQRIAGVMTHGRWLDRQALDAMLAEMRGRNRPVAQRSTPSRGNLQ